MPIDSKEEMGTKKPEERAQSSLAQDVIVFLREAVRRHWPALIALAVMIVGYSQTFVEWNAQWMKEHGYYSHGPLVLPIVIFMVWSIRAKLKKVDMRPSLWGLALLLPAIPIYAIGWVNGHGSLQSFAFMLSLIGGELLIFGPAVTRLLLFPSLFLISMIPMPSYVLDEVTGPIQQLSTLGASSVLKVLYSDTVRQGPNIYMPGWTFEVAEACSGFKLVISLLTFTAFFAYMVEGQLNRKVALFMFAAPFAVAINVLRISMVGLAGQWFGPEAGHAFHDYSGYISLVVAFILLFKIALWFGCRDFGESAFAPVPEGLFKPFAPRPAVWRNSFVLALVFGVVVCANCLIPKAEKTAKAEINRVQYARAFGHWYQYGDDQQIDRGVAIELKTADILSRDYMDNEGNKVSFMNVAGEDNDAFHSPRSCLPGSGWNITERKTIAIPVPGTKEGTITASTFTIVNPEDPTDKNVVLYWYQTGARTIPTTGQSRLNKLVRNIKLGTKEHKKVRETTYFYRLITPALDGEDAAAKRLERFVREFTLDREKYIQ